MKEDTAEVAEPSTDPVLRFPPEILVHISKHLDPSDFIIIRRISKSWCQTWSNLPIYTSLVKTHFRVYFETHNVSQNYEAFRTLACQQHNVQRGRYQSMATFSYDNQDYDPDRSTLDTIYHNGRVAWEVGRVVKVTTLVTGITKQYLNVDNARVRSFWLGNDLLVVQPSRRQKLYAWSLDSDAAFEIQIPPQTKHITLHDKQVGIATQRNVMIWTVGGDLQRTYPVGQTDTTTIPEAVLFHPTSQGTIVLISSCEMKAKDGKHLFVLRLIAEEYTNGTLRHTCFSDLPFYPTEPMFQVQFDTRPIDNNGMYSICWIYEEDTDLGNIPHACRFKPHDENDYYHLVSYDMYKKELVMRCFFSGADKISTNLYAAERDFCAGSYVWEDHMFTPVLDIHSASPHYLFQDVIACDQISRKPAAIRCICGDNGSIEAAIDKDLTMDLIGQKNGLLSFFTYMSETLLDKDPWTNLGWHRTVRGDEKFLVLLAERGYAVLCYDKGIVLPLHNQLPIEVLAYQP